MTTIIGWPRYSPVALVKARAVRSVAPPAGNGTISRTGLLGKSSWAVAGAAMGSANSDRMAAPPAIRGRMRRPDVFVMVFLSCSMKTAGFAIASINGPLALDLDLAALQDLFA